MSTKPRQIARSFTGRLFRLKAHGRDNDDTVVTPDDCFAKFNQKIPTWTPPEGKSSAVRRYIDR